MLSNNPSPEPNASVRQVKAWIREQIDLEVFAVDALLPALEVISTLNEDVSLDLVGQAISELVEDGTLIEIPDLGTMVAAEPRRTARIALVLPNIDSSLTRLLMEGVQSVFEPDVIPIDGGVSILREQTSVTVIDSHHSAQKEIENISRLDDLPLDGAIILPVAYGDILWRLARLHSNDFPLVLFDNLRPGLDFPSIRADDYGGSYIVTKHLLERGRRRLAWMGTDTTLSSASCRFDGFRDAIADFGLPFNRKLAFCIGSESPTDPCEPFVEKLVADLMAHPEGRPDGIVCCDDLIAITCIDALEKHRVRIPEEIAVVGFDDIWEASFSHPKLTTVRKPMRELGAAAARLLLARIFKTDHDPLVKQFPVELVIRESS